MKGEPCLPTFHHTHTPSPLFDNSPANHLIGRIPTRDEMQYIKDLFCEEEETVIEYHVPKSKHLNLHPNVLHLWRPQRINVPLPPSRMVAPKNAEEWQRVLANEPLTFES